jgi:hypothetical protein
LLPADGRRSEPYEGQNGSTAFLLLAPAAASRSPGPQTLLMDESPLAVWMRSYTRLEIAGKPVQDNRDRLEIASLLPRQKIAHIIVVIGG